MVNILKQKDMHLISENFAYIYIYIKDEVHDLEWKIHSRKIT